MDRLTRTLAGLGLAIFAAAGGCRSAHDEVPPGRVYQPQAGPGQGQVGFSTAPPARGNGMVGAPQNLGPGNMGAGGMFGSQPPGGDVTGTVPDSRFGAPGSSGGAMPSGAGASAGGPLSGLGQAPPLMGNPNAGPREDPVYLNGFPNQPPAAGAMGSATQPPSPL